MKVDRREMSAPRRPLDPRILALVQALAIKHAREDHEAEIERRTKKAAQDKG